MERTIRPRGLSAFAILNFIIAGVKGIFILGSLMTIQIVSTISESNSYLPGTDFSILLMVFTLVDALLIILLILSGIGYLRVNRILGLLLGNIFAILAFIKGCASIISWAELSFPVNVFNMSSFLIIGDLVFPLLTIIFLNIIFYNNWRTQHRFFDRMAETSQDSHIEPVQPVIEKTVQKDPTPHSFLVFGQSIRQTLRGSQGILFLYFSITLFLLIGQVIIWMCGAQGGFAANNSQNIEASQLMMKANAKEISFNHFVWALDETITDEDKEAKIPPKWSTMLAYEQPALLSLIYSVLFALFPIVIAFITFNQISEDSQRKGYRYILLRTTRKSIFFGKYLSALAIVIPLIIIVVVSISLFIHFIYQLYPFEQIIRFSIWTIFAFIAISIPSAAMCMMFSSMINSGILSLITSIGILSFGPLVLRLVREAWDIGFVFQYLLPGKAGYYLFHYEWWAIILAVIAMGIYTALFLSSGYFLFKRKSL